MKQKVIKLWVLGAVFVAAACSKTEPEVITEDSSYKLDAKEIYVETPAKFVYNTDNILRNESTKTIGLEVKVVDGVPELNTTTIPLTFRLRRALSKELVIKLEKDESLLARYSGDRENVKSFPDGTFSGLTVTIPAGQLTHTANITIVDSKQLTHTGGYLTAFRIDVPAEVSMAEDAKMLFVRANVTEPKVLLLNSIAEGWSEVESARYYFSPNKSSYYNNWEVWSKSYRLSAIKTAQNPAIAGLSIHMNTPSKRLKTVQIRAYNSSISDGETFELLTLSEAREAVYIRFTTPLTYSRIEITGMTPFSGSSIEIHDVKLYRKQ